MHFYGGTKLLHISDTALHKLSSPNIGFSFQQRIISLYSLFILTHADTNIHTHEKIKTVIGRFHINQSLELETVQALLSLGGSKQVCNLSTVS